MANSYGSWRTGIQIDNIYPVGSLYFSISGTNPGQLFGGTWEQIRDKFFLSAGDTYTAGTTGGSATMEHTHSQVAVTTGASSAASSGGPSTDTSGSTALTVAQLPSHTHTVPYRTGTNLGTGSSGMWVTDPGTVTAYAGATGSTGSGSGHTHTLSSHTHTIAHTHSISATTTGAASNTNNLPPYLVIYVFKRVA